MLALLFDLSESGVVELTSTGLVIFPTLKTKVLIVSVSLDPDSSLSIDQMFVFQSYVPLEASALINFNELGISSKTATLTAALGPRLVTIIVQTNSSPTKAFLELTSLMISKSQTGITSVVLKIQYCLHLNHQ
nr:hypothetical protein [uncultured Methanobrevibacter sp.]